MPDTTAHRLVKRHALLDASASERLWRLADVAAMAEDVFEDELAALCPLEKVVRLGSAPLPTSTSAQMLGREWLERGDALAMRVPSAVLPEESNVILNPRHPDFQQVELTVIRPFSFDERMFKQ